MTREETWNRLIELGVAEGEMPGKRWEFGNVNLHGANLRGADLGEASLNGADLREADLSEADLGGADLGRANLRGADLTGANLGEADLRGAILRGATLVKSRIDSTRFNLADLSGADITGATFWQASTGGWKIDGIRAEYVYFCRADEKDKKKYRRDFEKGQFEALHRALPTVELIFRDGLSPRQLFLLNAVIDETERQNPALGIRISEISNRGSQTLVRIETQKDEYLEKAGSLIQKALREAFKKGIPLAVMTQKINNSLPSTYRADIRPVATSQPLSLHLGKVEFSLSYIDSSGARLAAPKKSS